MNVDLHINDGYIRFEWLAIDVNLSDYLTFPVDKQVAHQLFQTLHIELI